MLDFMKRFVPQYIRDFLKLHLPQALLRLFNVMPSQSRNVEYNRALWDEYAREWDKKPVHIEDPKLDVNQSQFYLTCLGDEWGSKRDVDEIVQEYIYPHITRDSVVAEIGVGGGRIARRVAGMVKELYCLDISPQMLRKAQVALANYSNIRFILLHDPVLPDTLIGKCDFIYSFDVFVHLDLHTMWKYFMQVNRGLKQGHRAFIHTTNLKAPGGWDRFCVQSEYSVSGHYFISPEIVEILANHSGLQIVKTSTPEPTNFYLNRDYLVILEKRE
jgi:SAM-dependent methyltransferase